MPTPGPLGDGGDRGLRVGEEDLAGGVEDDLVVAGGLARGDRPAWCRKSLTCPQPNSGTDRSALLW